MSQYRINNVELEIDMDDADFQEKYRAAFESMKEREKVLLKTGEESKITREYCGLFYNLFDDIFGEGTGKKLFGGKHNARVCENVFDEFLKICGKQVQDSNKRRLEIMKRKYTPKSGR